MAGRELGRERASKACRPRRGLTGPASLYLRRASAAMPCAPPVLTPPRSSAPTGEKVVPLWEPPATRDERRLGPARKSEPAFFSTSGDAERRLYEPGVGPRGGGGWGRGARVAGIPARGEAAAGHCEAAAGLRGWAGAGGGGRAGAAPGARVGVGTGSRFPARTETRGRGGPGGAAESPASGCQKNITVNGGQCVCPPRKNAGFEDAKPLKLKIMPAAKSRTLAREALPGDGRRNAGKS